ncbi:hypothetical protein DFH29DRAFT_877276 [Suillus ampliporus]|nr:hypothetical protein DFH29DRAFT_877276 [Suillus ampliporus]
MSSIASSLWISIEHNIVELRWLVYQYVVIKEMTCDLHMEIDEKLAAGQLLQVGGRKVFFVAAMLRPETMCGQTYCFVDTSIKYGVFAIKDTEAFVCSYCGPITWLSKPDSTAVGDIWCGLGRHKD